MKVCTKCKVQKNYSEFSRRKQLKSGYRSQCKSCDKMHNDRYKKDNAERVKIQRAVYRENNRDDLRHDARVRKHQRRTLDKDIRIPTMEYFKKVQYERCVLCFERINWDSRYPDEDAATIEHLIPVSQGGTNLLVNLGASHWRCNRSKGNKIYWELIHRSVFLQELLSEKLLKQYKGWKNEKTKTKAQRRRA